MNEVISYKPRLFCKPIKLQVILKNRKIIKLSPNKESQVHELLESQAAIALKEVGIDRVTSCRTPGVQDRWFCVEESCEKLFSSLQSLKLHYIKIHHRPFACDIDDCVWSFPTKSKLERHKRAHETEKNFVCVAPGCGKTFKSRSNLRTHTKHIHEASSKFRCTVNNCQAAFHTKKNLDLHMHEHEEVEPAYRCEVATCGKSFFTRNALCTHMRRHEYEERDLQCKFCGKEFEVPCRLRTHLQSHENNRPFPCKEPGCHWSFPSQSKLARHMDIHMQIRRFACSFPGCTKAFMREQHRQDHLKTHLKVKIHRCPFCKTVFYNRTTVQSHVDKVHRKFDKSPSSSVKISDAGPTTTSPAVSSDKLAICDVKCIGIGSARTTLTYTDVVNRKLKQPVKTGVEEIENSSWQELNDITPGMDGSSLSPIGEKIFKDGANPDKPLCSSDVETRDLLQSFNPATINHDLMLSGVNDTSNLIMQDELLTQEYFLFLESNNRLADYEPSTINLRDLEVFSIRARMKRK